MLSFSDRGASALQVVLDAAGSLAGIRISGRLPEGPGAKVPYLELVAVRDVDSRDDWLISPQGVAVFVDPEVSSFLKGMVLDASDSDGDLPQFVVRRDEPALG